MTEQHLEDIKAAVRAALQEERTAFWVEAEQHYLHHKMLEGCQARQEECRVNREFITSMRKNFGDAKVVARNAVIGFIVIAVLAWIGGAAISSLAAVLGVKTP